MFKFGFLFVGLFLFVLFFGCTDSGTIIINNVEGVGLGYGNIEYDINYIDFVDIDDYSVVADCWGDLGDGNYGLCSCDDLNRVRTNLSGSYKLMNNIDFRNCDSSYNTGEGWLPIGFGATDALSFAGKFDGQNFKIKNLFINRPGSNRVGLFGRVRDGVGAEVRNVGLIDVNIIGNQFVGGLIAVNRGATISNSHVTGSVTGNSTNVGGLIGDNRGVVSDSYATGNITGNNQYTGGLIGINYSSVSNSYATGNVTGTSYVGGLIGRNSISGSLFGVVSNSYATGDVNSTINSSVTGGFVGRNYRAQITNSYSTGQVINSAGRGFCGSIDAGGDFADVGNFWDLNTSGRTANTGNAVGKTTIEMKTQSTFTSAGWDFDGNWVMGIINNNGYPYLKEQQFNNKYIGFKAIQDWNGTIVLYPSNINGFSNGNINLIQKKPNNSYEILKTITKNDADKNVLINNVTLIKNQYYYLTQDNENYFYSDNNNNKPTLPLGTNYMDINTSNNQEIFININDENNFYGFSKIELYKPNIQIGYQNPLTNTTNNILIGNFTGNNITTGTNNILIGHNLDTNTTTTNNQLNIANLIIADTNTKLIGINKTNPQYVLDINGNINIDGNIYANDFITKSKVKDFTIQTNSLGKLNNATEWLNEDKKINYKKHYAYTTYKITDYYNPIKTLEPKEYCWEDIKFLSEDLEKYETETICETVLETKTTYPIITIKGLSMETRIAEMEKMIWELKNALCKTDSKHEFC